MGELFVWATFFGALLFFFPVFVGVHGYLDGEAARIFFAVRVFGLRLVGGYAEPRKGGIAVHLTRHFALFLAYDKMGDTRKYFEITDGFQLMKLHAVVETGGADSVLGTLFASLIEAGGGAAYAVLGRRRPFLSVRSDTLLTAQPCLKVTAEAVTLFNGLVLVLALSKKVLEAWLNWIRKRSTASWKRRRRSF